MPASPLSFRPSIAEGAPSAPQPAPRVFSWTRIPERDGSIRLVLSGELDLAARGHFGSALAQAQADSDRVLLDLGELTLIDCASLSVIFAAAARSRREKSDLILLSPHGQVRRVLDLVGAPAGVVVDQVDQTVDRSELAA